MKKPLIAATLLAVLGASPAAHAAVEIWNQVETEVALPTQHPALPDALSLATDVRYSSALTGLERVQLRWGPRWNVAEWLELGLNHNAYLQQSAPDSLVQEQRIELQPTFEGTFGPVTLVDRNRLEFRWRPTSQRWRYRNQLRLEYPLTPEWTPFVHDEVFFDLSASGFNENRVGAGFEYEVDGTGWVVSYTYRTELAGGNWGSDHLVAWQWFTSVEPPSAVVTGRHHHLLD